MVVVQPLVRRLSGLIASGLLIWFGVWRYSLDNQHQDAMTNSGSSYSTFWAGGISILLAGLLIWFCLILPLHRAPNGKELQEIDRQLSEDVPVS